MGIFSVEKNQLVPNRFDSLLRTNKTTSELFNPPAITDYIKKRRKEMKAIMNEINRVAFAEQLV